jgi:hypothetical protein
VAVLGTDPLDQDPDLPSIPVADPEGQRLTLQELQKAIGDDRDESVIFHCGKGGHWGDLLAAHRVLNPEGVLHLAGTGYPHLRAYGDWQRENRRHLVPEGGPDLPEFAPKSWSLTVTLLAEETWFDGTLVATKDLPAALAEAAKAAPRDDAGRTRRGLELYASRDVDCDRLMALLRSALGGEARFASARLVLSRDDALVYAEAVPKGEGEVGEFPESGSEVLLEKIAASIPGKFGVVPAR